MSDLSVFSYHYVISCFHIEDKNSPDEKVHLHFSKYLKFKQTNKLKERWALPFSSAHLILSKVFSWSEFKKYLILAK